MPNSPVGTAGGFAELRAQLLSRTGLPGPARRRALARLTDGWLAVLAGVGLAASRFVWTSSAWFFPYALFWLLVIAVSIRLLRADRPGAAPHSPSNVTEEI